MRAIACWRRWRAVLGDDGSFGPSAIIVLRAAASLSRRRGIPPSRKASWRLACWLRTGNSPVSHATAVVTLRLIGSGRLGGYLVGHVYKTQKLDQIRVLQAVSRS